MKSRGGRTKRLTNNVCTVQLAPPPFCSSSSSLQVLEFHTRRGSMGLPPLSPSPFHRLPFHRQHSLAHAHFSPPVSFTGPRNPLLLFYLARPVFVSLHIPSLPLSLSFCLSLSLHRLIIYALSIVRARPRLCSHGRASNLIRSRGQRGEKRDGEGVDANPVKRRGGENDGNKKSDTIKGVKVDTIERETATRCTRDLFLQSDLTATPPRGYISAHCLSLACHRSPARRNTFAMT